MTNPNFFVLCKSGRVATEPRMLCRTADQKLCVWSSEDVASDYAASHAYDSWMARKATSTDYAIIGRMKANRRKHAECYVVMDREIFMSKKQATSMALVEIFENYATRKFAISSRAENEREFVDELSQALATAPTSDWNTRLKEILPLAVDLCCKYRGYKADSVIERRELIAGDLDMPREPA